MKFFLDTANLDELKKGAAWGIVDGVTTNPSLIAKEGRPTSPFVGRLDDIGFTGMDLIRSITQIYRNYGFKTQVLAASLRSPTHVIESALAGAHIGTMPFKVLDQLFNHPLTDKGLEQFLKDWGKVFHETPVAG
ncbi:MAG TPA: transaldolase family protein [Verrucomicrobiae bacterium]|nr:transaldolase family protein [Verrucomicrobiae bacterium]